MTYLEGQKALGLALNANLLLAAAKLYHLFQDYKSALEHYIKAGNTASGGCFAYFEASVAHFVEYRKTNELKKMKSSSIFKEKSTIPKFVCRRCIVVHE